MNLFHEIIVDNFAGGGGTSTGIHLATGRNVDIAINHDPAAIAMHRMNHPDTQHYCESVWDVVPRDAVQGRPVALVWLSPDCKHFSKAKGGKPVAKKIRGLAWVALRWAATVKPRVIMLENVEEFLTWGPLVTGPDGKQRPCPKPTSKGREFQVFVNALRRQGYTVQWQALRAYVFGTPTIRKRLFLIARRDGQPITWPQPTHAAPDSTAVRKGKLLPWRTAAECIDWSIPCPSIFDRKKPLVENTLRRIARGIQKFVIEADEPFIVPGTNVAPFITEFANASSQRNMAADEPLRTVCAQVKGGHFALVTAFLAKHYGGNYTGPGHDLTQPISTVTAVDHHALVSAFLVKYYGTNIGHGCNEPLQTITTKHRFGLVTVHGELHQIVDIGMRMLSPRELFNAQGFPADYIIDHDEHGKPVTKTAQIARCGNAVPPQFSAALVRANLPELCVDIDKQEEAA